MSLNRIIAAYALAAIPFTALTARALDLRRVRVGVIKAEPGGEFCADFRLTPANVRAFFRRAQELGVGQLHDQFDVLPCYVGGTAFIGKLPVKWEVRAGATGTIVSKDGSTMLFGCESCDDLFAAKPGK